ncbi:MAG: carotenoid 1,2-hydratase [Pikeienuella sp.]
MFSPYYAWRGRLNPEDHCTINVALYGTRNRWTMTERGAQTCHRSAAAFVVGPSRAAWDGRRFTVEIAETAVPHLTPVRGVVTVTPEPLTAYEAQLDPAGHHRWRPYGPLSSVSVELDRPRLSWTGHGYLDANFGARPLEADFVHWNWSRARIGGARGETARIFYEADRRDGSRLALHLGADTHGQVRDLGPPPPEAALPGTLWRVRRSTRSEGHVRVLRRLEDAPFYARAMLEAELDGARAEVVHETLDLDRFDRRWVKALLPWRMPRATWWGG